MLHFMHLFFTEQFTVSGLINNKLYPFKVNPDICLGITCLEGTRFEDGMAKSSFMTFNKPALEGTPCDFGKVRIHKILVYLLNNYINITQFSKIHSFA